MQRRGARRAESEPPDTCLGCERIVTLIFFPPSIHTIFKLMKNNIGGSHLCPFLISKPVLLSLPLWVEPNSTRTCIPCVRMCNTVFHSILSFRVTGPQLPAHLCLSWFCVSAQSSVRQSSSVHRALRRFSELGEASKRSWIIHYNFQFQHHLLFALGGCL